MKILVTGATGFVGRYVINELVKYGHQVIASSLNENKAKGFPWYPKVKYIAFDLQRESLAINLYEKFDKPDLLIHLAWQGLPNYKEMFHLSNNLPIHSAFLENMIENGLQQLLVTGTCFEYGKKEGCLSEEMKSNPQNSYASAKDSLRKFLEGLQGQKSFILKWVRLFYMYGEGQNPNSLFSQLDLALQNGDKVFNMSKGEQVRDYLPIEKMAQYIVKIAIQNKINGIINCCSGVPVKVKTLVENYIAKKNKNIQLNLGYYPYPDYEAMSFWGDDRKLKEVIVPD